MRNIFGNIYRNCITLKRLCLKVIDTRSTTPKALILVYHRVNNLESDPLQLAVSPDNFTEQLIWLKNRFEIISLSELMSRIKTKTLRGNEIVITFDDGYKDNLTHALPIAKKLNIPLSIFISTVILDNPYSFYLG